jgi:hypothetical protein
LVASAWASDLATLNIFNCNNCNITWENSLSTVNFNKNTEVTIYKSWQSYAVWAQVVHMWTVYKCKTAHTATEDFVWANWDWTNWSVISNLTWCNINIDWVVYMKWKIIWNNINNCNVILTNDKDSSINGTWALVQWNYFDMSSREWILIVSICCTLSNNHIIANENTYYNDNYHIIKDNIVVPFTEGWNPTIIKKWSSSTSKESDNLLVYTQS